MKGYFTIIIVAVIIVMANIDRICPRDGGRNFADILEEQINICPISVHTDDNFGFRVPYPVLFVPDSNADDSIIGSSRFSYNNITQITIDCYVCRNDGISDADGGVARLAAKMQAEVVRDGGDIFMYGPLVENGCPAQGYSHFTKCVARDKIWVIYSLIYPDKYAKQLSRLFALVKTWQPWDKSCLPNSL